jgi:hypothetical protein
LCRSPGKRLSLKESDAAADLIFAKLQELDREVSIGSKADTRLNVRNGSKADIPLSPAQASLSARGKDYSQLQRPLGGHYQLEGCQARTPGGNPPTLNQYMLARAREMLRFVSCGLRAGVRSEQPWSLIAPLPFQPANVCFRPKADVTIALAAGVRLNLRQSRLVSPQV